MVFDRIKEIILDELKISEEKITMDARLVEDIGADSLDAVELIMTIEDEYDIKISDEQAKEIKTIGDIVRFVESSKK